MHFFSAPASFFRPSQDMFGLNSNFLHLRERGMYYSRFNGTSPNVSLSPAFAGVILLHLSAEVVIARCLHVIFSTVSVVRSGLC